MYDQNEHTTQNIEVDELAKSYLLETAKWANFISIVGFVLIGIMALIGLGVMLLGSGSGYSYRESYGSFFPFRLMGFTYLVFAAIGFYPCYALNRFSNNMKVALHNTNKESFNSGLSHLKGTFKFYGIFLIIYLSFIVLAIFIAIIAGVAGVFMNH